MYKQFLETHEWFILQTYIFFNDFDSHWLYELVFLFNLVHLRVRALMSHDQRCS